MKNVLLLLAAVCLSGCGKTQQWEYKAIAPADEISSDVLDILGRDGWELISSRRANASESNTPKWVSECLLKRPCNRPKASDEYRAAVDEYMKLQAEYDAIIAKTDKLMKLSPTAADFKLISDAAKKYDDLSSKATDRIIKAKQSDNK